MSARWLKSAVLVSLFAASLQAQSREAVVERLHSSPALREWRLVGEPSDYDATNIDDFSQAPVASLKVFGIRGARVIQWDTPRGRIRLSLFEMIDPPAAYGVFTSLRTAGARPTPVLIGAGSFQDGALCFWQSSYAVRIEGARDLQTELASVVSEQILGSSWKPVVAEHLPPAHLVAGSERYHLALDSIPEVPGVNPNQLGFENSVEAASANYSVNGKTARLLLLHYPTQHIARKYEQDLDTAGVPGFRKRDGPLLAMVYGTNQEPVARAILDGVDLEYAVVYDETNPVATYAQMILAIFKLIGIVLLLTVGTGILYGGFRVLVKRRFPNRVFDRPQDVEIIQLKLDESLTSKKLHDPRLD